MDGVGVKSRGGRGCQIAQSGRMQNCGIGVGFVGAIGQDAPKRFGR